MNKEQNGTADVVLSKKKVLIIISSFVIGGAERILYEIICALNDRIDFTIITTTSHENIWYEKFRSKVRAVYNLNEIPEHKDWAPFVLHAIRENNIELLITYHSTFAFEMLGTIKTYAPMVQIICMIHSLLESLNKYIGMYKEYIDVFVAVSENVKSMTVTTYQIPDEKIIVIRNGIDISETFNPDSKKNMIACRSVSSPCAKRNVVWMGRVSPEKLPLDFIELAARFEKREEYFFWMFGNGKLKRQALEKSLYLPRLQIHDPIDDVSFVLAQSYALVLTSETEATPLVVLEALSMNVPVVATRVGEVEHLIRNGENGFIADVGDIDGMAAALDTISSIRREIIRSLIPSDFYLETMLKSYERKIFFPE